MEATALFWKRPYTDHTKRMVLGLLLVILGSLLFVTGHSDATTAASCQKSVTRYAGTTNTIYIAGADVVCTPADIQVMYPSSMKHPKARTFMLKSNIVLQQGATLIIKGGTASDATTDEFRMMSNNNNMTNNFVNITADYGTVHITNTKVKSWDEATKAADTEYGDIYKRAFIRVRSRAIGNVQNISRMNIVNSDIGYLGYYGAESYGLAWKVMDSAFDKVDVLGNITNSRIHNNYFGVYTFGAFGMVINQNEFDHNIKYGLDPHDDSDSLKITNNSSHHNGDHGIICSQRCDNLLISGNNSYSNAGHGIMLHRSVDNSIIENNTVAYNGDTGIALFESNHNIIRGNLVKSNKNGIRLSVGSSYNLFENNIIEKTKEIAIYTYKGSDTPVRSDGINAGNAWKTNTVTGTGLLVLQLTATHGDQFKSNSFAGNPLAGYDTNRVTNTSFVSNSTDLNNL